MVSNMTDPVINELLKQAQRRKAWHAGAAQLDPVGNRLCAQVACTNHLAWSSSCGGSLKTELMQRFGRTFGFEQGDMCTTRAMTNGSLRIIHHRAADVGHAKVTKTIFRIEVGFS